MSCSWGSSLFMCLASLLERLLRDKLVKEIPFHRRIRHSMNSRISSLWLFYGSSQRGCYPAAGCQTTHECSCGRWKRNLLRNLHCLILLMLSQIHFFYNNIIFLWLKLQPAYKSYLKNNSFSSAIFLALVLAEL